MHRRIRRTVDFTVSDKGLAATRLARCPQAGDRGSRSRLDDHAGGLLPFGQAPVPALGDGTTEPGQKRFQAPWRVIPAGASVQLQRFFDEFIENVV
jgi:hypothetical protein